MPLVTVSSSKEAFNNVGVQFANFLRASGDLPASRAIVIVPNWARNKSIGEWVPTNKSPHMWSELQRHLALLSALHPSAAIDHIIVAQGEADSSAASTPYNSMQAYADAFDCLLEQFKALPQWRLGVTTVSVQELARFAGSERWTSRNDAFDRLRDRPPAGVCVVQTDGLAESQETRRPHFDGESIVELGARHYLAWRRMRR
ncbi:sialate O-acetylesterase [Acidisphaera sp. L21]|uniref:sialate O-acetylesterase n=1 Tax=Acidisphaera sp. L21 TaxID=1641851 RepID=UPI00131BAD15|nr:sialate O-acetylesterase [Acidisphaera sp. L21]